MLVIVICRWLFIITTNTELLNLWHPLEVHKTSSGVLGRQNQIHIHIYLRRGSTGFVKCSLLKGVVFEKDGEPLNNASSTT